MHERSTIPARPPLAAFGGGMPAIMLGGMLAGTLAFVILVVVQLADLRYVAVLIVGIAILVALPLINRVRPLCLYAILVFAPFGLRASFFQFPHMGGAGAMFIEVVDPFMLLLLYFQVRDRIKGTRATYRFPLACAFWSAMILLGVGSVIFQSTLRVTAANEVVRMTKLLVLALLIVNEVVTRRQVRGAIIALTLGIILQSGIALAQFLRGSQLGLAFIGEATNAEIKTLSDATLLTGDFVYRVSGLFGHANLLAGYLALYLPVAVALVLAPVSWRLKTLAAIALLVGQPALILTLSRAGWIDFMVAFAMVLILGTSHVISRRRYLLARIVIITVTVSVVVALSPKIIQRLYETDPSAVEFRIKWLKVARAMILDNPVLGVGLNKYVFAQLDYGEHRTPTEMQDTYGDYWPAVHNSWALTWAEQGTVGILLFAALHLAVIVVGVRNLRIRDPMMHAVSVGLLAGFVAIMIDGMASFFVRVEGPARMFWIALGLILAIGYWRRANERSIPAAVQSFPAARASRAIPEATGGRWLPSPRQSILR